jgi:hypothetical protein
MRQRFVGLLVLISCSAPDRQPARDSAIQSTLIASASEPPQDDAARAGLTFPGYPRQPQFKWLGGKSFVRGDSTYSLFAVRASDRVEVWLAVRIDTMGRGDSREIWKVVASMLPHDTLSDSIVVWAQDCVRDNHDDPASFAVVRFQPKELHQRALHAWFVDPRTRRFSSAPAATVNCIDAAAPGVAAYYDSVEKADRQANTKEPVLRLPNVIASLPAAVRDTLVHRACLVPQFRGDTTANVVQADFYGDGGTAWAVWCVDRNGENSRLFVFRRDSAPVEIPQAGSPTDAGARIHAYDPSISGQEYGCIASISRLNVGKDWKTIAIDVTGPDALSAAERAMRPHDGILDSDCDGTSNIHYWTGKRWILLAGMD